MHACIMELDSQCAVSQAYQVYCARVDIFWHIHERIQLILPAPCNWYVEDVPLSRTCQCPQTKKRYCYNCQAARHAGMATALKSHKSKTSKRQKTTCLSFLDKWLSPFYSLRSTISSDSLHIHIEGEAIAMLSYTWWYNEMKQCW